MSELERVHQTLLPVLEDAIRVMDENHLPYSVICGTLLGAVRHQGFIPWDDDIDLVMPRDSYEQFEALYPLRAKEPFMLDLTDTWVPRVRDKNDPEAFVDLFVLDPLPDGKLARAIKLLRLRTLQGMLKEHVDYSRFSFVKRAALRVTHVLGLPFSKRQKLRHYRRVAMATRPQSKQVHMSNGAFDLLEMPFDRADFAELIRLPFDGLMVSAPKNHAAVLTRLYGPDYMTPPPESERTARHLPKEGIALGE